MSSERKFDCSFHGDHVSLENSVLPAEELRLCGPEFADDRYFLRSARAEADRLKVHCGLASSTNVLDVGCGVGRLPIGILSTVGDIRSYCGVDVIRRCIEWCDRHIHSEHPSFSFFYIDAKNARYNPEGREIDRQFILPFPPHSFDIIYSYSVFSHMLPDDMQLYVSEFQRLLNADGRVFATGFVEESVPDVSVNPEDYRMQWSGPLHCVRYSRRFIEETFAAADLLLYQFDYATETDGQSAMYFRRQKTK